MNWHTLRAFAATAAAGATVTTLGLLGGGVAGATARPSAQPALYTQSVAGYKTGGWNFRYIAATVKVPASQPVAANSGVAAISLDRGNDYLAMISVKAGGGWGTVAFYEKNFAIGKFHLTPKVGDVLQISIYRDKWTGKDHFAVTDTTTGKSREEVVATPATLVPRHATFGCWIGNAQVIRPPADVRLWAFKDAALTSYNGAHGTTVGPWTTHQLIDTTTGTPTGAIVMYPSYAWNSGANFSVWLNRR
jgi:hypothetical protein